MKVFELFEARTTFADAALATEKDLKVDGPDADGYYKISVTPTSGPLIHLIRLLAFSARTQVRTKSGGALPRYDKFKANGILMKAPNKEALDSRIARAIKQYNSYVKSETRHKERAPERKKEAAKYASEQNKKRKAEYEEKYGKGTAARVTYRQEGGDDGYQYVVRVDGRAKWTGLTRSEAERYAHQERDELAKKGKLGKYAEKK